MQKQQFNSGTPISPEWLNDIQNPSYDKTSEEVGYLPLPPGYTDRIDTFETATSEVNVSSATASFAVIVYRGSPTSSAPVTLMVNGLTGSPIRSFLVVATGAEFELTVRVPVNSTSTTDITLHAGCSAILSRFSYGGNTIWKYAELTRQDCSAYVLSLVATNVVQVPKVRYGNNDHYIDVELDLNQEHTSTYLGLLFGGYSGLNSDLTIHFPKIKVWKQAFFNKDVTIDANLQVNKTTHIGSAQDGASLNVYGQIFSSQSIIGRNVPNGTTSIGNRVDGGDAYLDWQLKSNWEVGQVKKIFNDTSSAITQDVMVPHTAGLTNSGYLRDIVFPAYTYREFTCVGYCTYSLYEFAVLAPSA